MYTCSHKMEEMMKKFISAAENNDKETLRSLIKKGFDVNYQIPVTDYGGNIHNGHSALSMAVLSENVELVLLLLENGADPRLTIYENGETYRDLSFYLSYEHLPRTMCDRAPYVTKFGFLVSAVLEQKKLLDNPGERVTILKIKELISKAKDATV